MKAGSDSGMIWEQALGYAESLVLAGHEDWRLPHAKELQSIVDYTRSPATTGSAAIDPVFDVTPIVDEGGGEDYPFYWTSTTHANWTSTPGRNAAYVAFGTALGFMEIPPGSGNYLLQDVHGAGAQRSDPKVGDPTDYPHGHGPQGDVIRIFNFVRCVRDAGAPICGNADGSGGVDIDDAVYLISYIFSGGPPPEPFELGDVDCSGDVDIDDVVYLIGYIFSGGHDPCDTDGDGNEEC
jgi:hypothetical protein